jgi:hypothetical protein
MALTNVSVNKINLWAVVAGVEIELTQVDLSYSLNTIPTATLSCAIGREVKSLIPAPIHSIYDQLKVNIPIIVYCEAREAAVVGRSGGPWPGGPFVVFDGFIVGVGYTKSRSGSANLSLSCRNFLVGLEFSWTPNKTTHPLNMGNWHNPARIMLDPQSPSFVVSTVANAKFTSSTIKTDYWALALQPFLTEICNRAQLFEGEAVEAGNTDAIIALQRFEPFFGGYKFGVALSMNSFGIIGTEPGIQSIVTDASNEGLRAMRGGTIWEKIVADYGSRYLFTVTPMARRALVTPVIPGLTQVWKTIDPSEYDSIGIQNYLPRPLRGIILETGANSMTGAPGHNRGTALDITTVGGRFENPNMDRGMLYFRDAPQWIANAVSQMAWAKGSVLGVKGNAFAGQAGNPPALPRPAALRTLAKVLWDEYAKAMYLIEVFKTRRGNITGKIRFDIAPGSSVALITTEEKFVAASGANKGTQTLFGIVTKVGISINSESCQGYTSLEIGFLRDEAENVDANLTTPRHPLWSQPWAGAPLIDESPI